MPLARALAFLPILFCAQLASAQKDVDLVEPTLKAPRGKALGWKSAQGKTYWYRLPKDIDGKQPPDLLLMLHGTGGKPGWSFWNYDIGGDFRKRDIVVSPDGMTPGGDGTFNFVQGPKDGEQIAGLIADFKQRFPIGRVYLYGHSQGAFFCYWFGGEYPELIDGFVAHAGNLLGTKHSKLAKQKLGIGILHGRADAVVPVICATETAKVYREQGYEKLKVEIVEGLTAETGHWPLPMQVAQMLTWLDQVSTQSAAQAVRTAASELRRATPSLRVVAEQMAKARKLLPKAEDADKKELPAVLAALQTFLDKAALVHAQALLADPATLDPKSTWGPWASQFLLLRSAFEDHPEWKKLMVKPRELSARHERLLDKAIKGLAKPSKESRAAAVKAFDEAFLTATHELLPLLLEQLEKAGANEAELRRHVVDESKARAGITPDAQNAIQERLAPLLAELKAAQPGLFVDPDAEAAGDGK